MLACAIRFSLVPSAELPVGSPYPIMRGVFFYSVAFAANAAVASVCKPRPRSSGKQSRRRPGLPFPRSF